jgi:putative exporter of polyketide antibiotics
MENTEVATAWLHRRSRRNHQVSLISVSDMKIGLQIQKLIEWLVVLFLVVLVDRFAPSAS